MTEFFAGGSNKPFIWMDPRSKGLVFLATNIAMWTGVNTLPEAVFFGFIMLLVINGRRYAMALWSSVFYYGFIALDAYAVPMFSGSLARIFLTVVSIVRFYLPILISAAFLIQTTTVSEFVAAFTRMKVSQKIIIPFSVMFRFFPTIAEENRNISKAMKFRGIGLSAKSLVTAPITTLEYYIVPLLMSSAKIANELSAASLARGLGGSARRTCLQEIAFGVLDYIILLCVLVYVVYVLFIG